MPTSHRSILHSKFAQTFGISLSDLTFWFQIVALHIECSLQSLHTEVCALNYSKATAQLKFFQVDKLQEINILN
jgi:hypothetical protein